jgi:hypothetical protein
LEDECNYYAHKQNLNKDFQQVRRRAKSNMEIIKYCEDQLENDAQWTMARVRSTDEINAKIKFKIANDVCSAKKEQQTRTSSLPNLLDFVEYKQAMPTDDVLKQDEDNDREWVRKIWNRWFDEVIDYPGRDAAIANANSPKQVASFQSFSRHLNELNDSSLDMSKKKAPVKPVDSIFDLNVPEQVLDVDINILKDIESELNELNMKIAEKLRVFDLARRGCLYRKVSGLLEMNSYLTATDMFELMILWWHFYLVKVSQFNNKKMRDQGDQLFSPNPRSGGGFCREKNF